jgi:N-acyl-D-amino-acid deacylase
MVQLADGYAATVISGVATHLDGKPTGGMPGRLVRGAQPSPGPSDK